MGGNATTSDILCLWFFATNVGPWPGWNVLKEHFGTSLWGCRGGGGKQGRSFHGVEQDFLHFNLSFRG